MYLLSHACDEPEEVSESDVWLLIKNAFAGMAAMESARTAPQGRWSGNGHDAIERSSEQQSN